MKRNMLYAGIVCTVLILCAGCTSQNKEKTTEATETTETTETKDITVVSTDKGKIQGSIEDGVVYFKGIPFAEPPVGELRFAPPKEASSWEDTLECKEFKAMAPQIQADGEVIGDEDCLYLNVWAPEGALDGTVKEKLPTLVFIHGGAFATGTTSNPMYDGTAFAKDDVIYISIGYRLNALGFLTSDKLEEACGYNVGIKDQIAALQWVKDNIDQFGGDSNNVTISGESAGAMSVSALTMSSEAEGLFQQAIMESGSVFTQPIVDSKGGADIETSIARGNAFMEALGASDLESLRKMDVDTLVKKSAFSKDMTNQNPYCLMPVMDGKTISSQPYKDLTEGRIKGVNLLAGYNTDEGTSFIPEGISEETYQNFVKDIFGEDSGKVLERYPVDAAHTPTDRARALVKMSFQMGCQIYGDAWTEQGTDVYVYNFDYHVPGYDKLGMGVMHGLELPFVFDTFAEDEELLEDGEAMIEQVHDYWVSFVKTGNPNHEENHSPKWPLYTAETKEILKINSDSKATALENQEDIDFYRQLLWEQ